MSRSYIYLDCDEVLLQTAVAHARFLKQNYKIDVDINKYPSQWDFSKLNGLDFKKSTLLFTQSSYFSNIPAVAGAVEAVNMLKQHGYNLSVISSISDATEARQTRIANLENVFGLVFDDISLLPLGWANKADYYKSVPTGIAVDDSIFNLQDAIATGHRGLFISIPQNAPHVDIATQYKIPTAASLLELVRSDMVKHR